MRTLLLKRENYRRQAQAQRVFVGIVAFDIINIIVKDTHDKDTLVFYTWSTWKICQNLQVSLFFFLLVKFLSCNLLVFYLCSLQGTVLDRHALTLQFCQVKEDKRALNRADKDRSSTKLHVKDVASNVFPFGKVICFSLLSFIYCMDFHCIHKLNTVVGPNDKFCNGCGGILRIFYLVSKFDFHLV